MSAPASHAGETGASWLDLGGRVCVVTGAAGGIGREIALDLARAGAALVLLDMNEAACAAVAREIDALGARALALGADVASEASVAAAAAASLAAFGPCHVLVNTPAISGRPDRLLDLEFEKWSRQMAVNLGGYLLCSQQFGRQMREARRGSLIHVGSIAGQMPQPESGAYSIAKAGMAMMSRVFALELGKAGIRSNVVSPALVRTALSERFYSDPDILRRREELVPLGRIGSPSHIAQAVLFLASDRSGYITGQDLLIDGGVSLTLMGLFPRPA